MKQTYLFILMASILTSSCREGSEEKFDVRLVTLDPGHFHAALVQKSMYEDVDSTVYVYAPEGPDVQLHLSRINGYNTRADSPTHWNEVVYTGDDFEKRMLAEKKGNVVVLAGNNEHKTSYILDAIRGGFNVLADKPMAIDSANFHKLKTSFEEAAGKKLLLYDIMTERFEITNLLQRELAGIPEIFGTLEKGSPEQPAVEMESVHYLYKYVSGNVLVRPAWSLDVLQQGEAITDVGTHLVDLVQWACFPDQSINYEKDIELLDAGRWTTDLSQQDFRTITQLDTFPSFLKKNISNDSVLRVYANGDFLYRLKGVHVKVIARWDFKAPEGSGDTHRSVLHGTKASLVIRQGKEQGYKPRLYIEPVSISDSSYLNAVPPAFEKLRASFPGIALEKASKGWEVMIPEHYKEGHEAHFAAVTKNFLQYLKNGSLPDWEVPNMMAKYYTTTRALQMAKTNAASGGQQLSSHK
ncbi:MAG: putative oxidoreductase C-terminal domain-containing protein [Flavisolibacter sp.]